MVALSVSTKGIFLIALAPIVLIYYYVQRYFRKSSTEIQRLESVSRSPIYAAFGQTLQGASTIRAYGDEARFVRECDASLDRNNVPGVLQQMASNWLSVRLDFIGALASFSVACIAAADSDLLPAGWVAVGLSFSLEMTSFLKHAVRMYAQAEADMNAVERIRYYAEELEPEAAEHLPDRAPPPSWPTAGAMSVRDLRLRYRDGPLVLKGLTFDVRAGEKVGVVGRTGAGKSSLMAAIWRLVEPGPLSVFIDGVDISTIGLHDLRSRIAIVPQDPVLFSTSLRRNLDPFDEHSDAACWEALERVQLKAKIEALSEQLAHQVDEGGANLSVGERQLLCIARALLRRPRLLVADEATASVDRDTDAMIQRMLRECFRDSTVLTIAHRLHTVADADRVLVLDDGNLREFDAPAKLLRVDGGAFRGMVEAMGEAAARHVRAVADGEVALVSGKAGMWTPRGEDGGEGGGGDGGDDGGTAAARADNPPAPADGGGQQPEVTYPQVDAQVEAQEQAQAQADESMVTINMDDE